MVIVPPTRATSHYKGGDTIIYVIVVLFVRK